VLKFQDGTICLVGAVLTYGRHIKSLDLGVLGKGRFMARTMNISTMYTGKLTRITLSLTAALSFMAGFAQVAAAQQADVVQPQQIFQDQENRDPFSGRGGNQAGSVMDLVHRAQQAGSLSYEDFQSQQQENLDSVTAGFREAQKKRLSGSQTPPVVAPSPAPTSQSPL
jgi:hypothetical protein